MPPAPAGKWPVSSDGGVSPVWSEDGRQLYYVAGQPNISGGGSVIANGTGADGLVLLGTDGSDEMDAAKLWYGVLAALQPELGETFALS